MITRQIQRTLEENLFSGKALVLMGARQTGKTTLLKQIFQLRQDVMWLNGDDADTIALFENASSSRLKAIFGKYKIVVVDEAQRIETKPKDLLLRQWNP